ncbi:hypothetical protein NIES4071_103160 (plasmid) [Calothrix sp. NIES-4071]|nr:hypothetical protein NIES4071_103160 [Calothrix sp. NIES-4071]BAZ64697.1 hypothetical protein NIES4105_104300 [Calothrix sp. NIES-4105]
MPDWTKVEKSFLRISRQRQLGELASSLSRFKSWALAGQANREVALVVLDESILYVSLLQKESFIPELSELQKQLLQARHNWSTITNNEAELLKVTEISAAWSEKVLDMSGLLELIK